VSRPVTKTDLSLLTPLAHRIARWIIPRLPAWVTPNQVTMFGLLVNVVGGVCFYLASFNRTLLFGAIVCLVLNWVADNLDGELARARQLTSERGFYLDLLVDQFGVAIVCLGIAFAHYTYTPLLLTLALSYPLMSYVTLLHVVMRQHFPLGRISPAEGRMGLIVLALLTFAFPAPLLTIGGQPLGWFDLVTPIALLPAFYERAADAVALYRQLEPPRRG
jgi:phosphatidylglycerophosphate synthase